MLASQMERRARLRKMLAEMDEDEKVDKLGDHYIPCFSCSCAHIDCATFVDPAAIQGYQA